jgi:hypothetical protein
MKKFSKINGEKVSEEPKVEVKITEADIFKSKVMTLMDDFLRVQIYGPITRYHVAGTMKVAGKELFLEALLDLLNTKSSDDKVKLLESLKSKITDWKVIDETIDLLNSEDSVIFKQRMSLKSLYNKYKSDINLLIEQTEKSASKIKSTEVALLKYKACESLLNESEFNSEIIKKMSEKYLDRLNQLTNQP